MDLKKLKINWKIGGGHTQQHFLQALAKVWQFQVELFAADQEKIDQSHSLVLRLKEQGLFVLFGADSYSVDPISYKIFIFHLEGRSLDLKTL